MIDATQRRIIDESRCRVTINRRRDGFSVTGFNLFSNTNWVFLTIFIAINLIQSAFTHWCPMKTILKNADLQE
ncbi:DUF2892 domain-containing protein [Aliiglaciecola litoralis]|uniref:YgaP family membrane protein n=1 Tax=Aliiglaciecola litoralis TaxID=582857 RepID=UPI0031D96202